MYIFDAHCDVLWQLWQNKNHVNFTNDVKLHVTMNNLKKANGKVQCFAIFVPDEVPFEQRFDVALSMVELFYCEILEKNPEMKLIVTKSDVESLKSGEIGALLTLEGCDAIGRNINRLHILHRLGVRSVGLTWNYSNFVCDGALEPRGAGLSKFGRDVINVLNEYHLWTDVSHLSEKGFWDVMETANNPIASHSNCYTLRQHPRNLKDEQIKALIQKNGMIGVTFVPSFIKESQSVQIIDVLRHVEHICSLGGEKNIGFGSDFDGITETVQQLESYTGYKNLIDELLKQYKEELVERFLYKNFLEHITF